MTGGVSQQQVSLVEQLHQVPLSILHIVDAHTDIYQLHEVLQTEVQVLNVPEHFFIDLPTHILRLQVRHLLFKIFQFPLSCFDQSLLCCKVCKVIEELEGITNRPETKVKLFHICKQSPSTKQKEAKRSVQMTKKVCLPFSENLIWV